jgi:hypothetical protein
MHCRIEIFALSILVAVVTALGCSGIVPCDNQRDLPAHIEAAVNPIPIRRHFIQNNSHHKILVAVIDTGIDYNHPKLVNNIHFCLDRNHRPVRLGWDFIGQDGWPSPYIGRRNSVSDFERDVIDKLIHEEAALEIYLDKRRNVVQECLASAWHGTSLEGLIVQDCRYIGLLGYRVIPPNRMPQVHPDYALQISENLLRACRCAVEDGANIVVMTAFLHFDMADDDISYLRMKKLRHQFEELLKIHDDVLFLASAGNCNGYTFSGQAANQIDFPAGIPAENLLVVGSFSKEGHPSCFSNIPSHQIRAVYFPGEDMECICPLKMLGLPDKYLATLPAFFDDLLEGNESYGSLVSYLQMMGIKEPMINSGTSFSTALAASACAKLWVENAQAAPRDIIEKLLEVFGGSF